MSANSYHQQRTLVTDAPSGCPIDHTWSALDDAYLADPYPIASRFRDEQPIVFAERLGYVMVSRMEDILAVFTDPDTYASVNVQDPVFPLSDEAAAVLSSPDFNPVAVMSNRPEPDHGRIRVFTREGFSNRRLKALEPYIARRSHELIDRLLTMPTPVELIRAFAFPLPGETVFRLIGFPESDDEMLKSWCVDRKAFQWGNPTPEQQREIAEHMLSYWRYCREFTAQRLDDPHDDRSPTAKWNRSSTACRSPATKPSPASSATRCCACRRDATSGTSCAATPVSSPTRSRRCCASIRARSRGAASRRARPSCAV
ncbi:MAG: hypothetical protein HZB15_08265 [Actinobacteria bacterium]|nr:hypothetical protein [Actinomycetota bacterium]